MNLDAGLRHHCLTWLLTGFAIAGCGGQNEPNDRSTEPRLFELLPASATGIDFRNDLPERADINILNYLYYYNGGGVAAGDIDNDGLPDLYFTSNRGPDKLYRNLGNYRFEDITASAGVPGPDGWSSGVTMADVNGDGFLDIYVSAVHYLAMKGENILYINNGDRTFTDRTREYGLQHAGYSTQAAFFDYDADGDLDMYLLNHSIHLERSVSARPQRSPRHPRAGDRLFRNDGGRFTDVSERAGIYGGVEGYGLGVVTSDFDLDGCVDMFIANDFQENDFLYRNNCDGTFTESITRAMGHTSRFSMGADAADYNDDGRPDLVVLDMLPEREEILKTSANAENFNIYDLKVRAGYHPQYARNTLQLNRGLGRFSDVGYLAGVHATDWSWAALFADLDNDGDKDLLVTNGIARRPNDLDYINFVGNDAVQKPLAMALPDRLEEENLRLIDSMPEVPLAKYAFRNNGDLTFTNVATPWGLAEEGFTSGAVYVDLTNSGALDLVVNAVNGPAQIYRNHARSRTSNHWLGVSLRGDGANTTGIGAKVVVVHDGRRQMLEQFPTRGFQSAVDHRLHFGLGASTRVDSLLVVWPDHRYEMLSGVAADQIIEVRQANASGKYTYTRPSSSPGLFDSLTSAALSFRHAESVFYDYNREPLIPHKLSIEGPALATGDVNGDGLDDVFLGGAKWQPAQLFLQQRDGAFRSPNPRAFVADSLAEDVDAAFFDADGDGDLDLYVVSGGNEFWGEEDALLDRLYLNDGRGGFTREASALPALYENGSCVAPGDFDGDGDVDLFVGTRVIARSYGVIPKSYLLENDGRGRFRDVTSEKAPELSSAGMVTSAAWADTDADGALDLVVAGEWMPVRIFGNERGRLTERTKAAGFADTHGFWNSVTAADLNRDGRVDFVLGNLGLNSYLRASADEPARMYVHDFFDNGTIEQIVSFHKDGESYPIAGRDDLVKLFPQLRSAYPSYKSFGASRVEEIFPASELARAQVREAKTFASAVAINRGDGSFAVTALPAEAQFAPVFATVADDVDGDGHVDLITAGNFDGVTPMRGRYDASYGLLLRGDGTGRFAAVDLEESRLVTTGQVRGLAMVSGPGGDRVLVVARNNDAVQLFRARAPRPRVELEPLAVSPRR